MRKQCARVTFWPDVDCFRPGDGRVSSATLVYKKGAIHTLKTQGKPRMRKTLKKQADTDQYR